MWTFLESEETLFDAQEHITSARIRVSRVFILIPNDEWWHRRIQAPIPRRSLSPVATHGLFGILVVRLSFSEVVVGSRLESIKYNVVASSIVPRFLIS